MTPAALPNPRPSFLTILLQVGGQLGGIIGVAAFFVAVEAGVMIFGAAVS